jgi:phenylalanyl-tRNA synthetase beta chain
VSYKAIADKEISFVPLACGGFTATGAMSPRHILAEHVKGKAFAHLLEGFERYPLLIDEKGTVLSMPPIINSEATRVTKATKNFFIDVTGLNMNTVEKTLNIIVTSLKDSMPACEIRSVTLTYPDKSVISTPRLGPSTFTLNYGRCAALLGCDLSKEGIIDCLLRMRFDALDKGDYCEVSAPCYRADIRHEQDLIEDVAIAHGYKNLTPRKLAAFTPGALLPAEVKKQQLREAMVSMGFLEIVSIMLTSEQREFVRLGLPTPENRIIIDNPISTDQTIVRTGLTSGILEIIAANTSNELPQRVFETGETAQVNGVGEVEESVALCAGIVDSKAGFSDIKSILKNIMHEVGRECTLEAKDLPMYLSGRSGLISVDGRVVGHVGEVHPRVLDDFKIPNPAALMEIDLSKMGIIGG